MGRPPGAREIDGESVRKGTTSTGPAGKRIIIKKTVPTGTLAPEEGSNRPCRLDPHPEVSKSSRTTQVLFQPRHLPWDSVCVCEPFTSGILVPHSSPALLDVSRTR